MGDERQYLCWDGVIRVQSEQRPPAKGEWWTWPENCPSAVQASTDYREIDPDGDYIILEPFNANGPQVPKAPPNPATDICPSCDLYRGECSCFDSPAVDVGLVTVELTREEAEHAMARGEHPSNAPMVNGYFCPDCMRIAAKLRASLERTGK